MLQTTIEAARAMLKADPTISPNERSAILAAIRRAGHKEPYSPSQAVGVDRVLSRKDVAARFGRTTRAVDKWSKEGHLTRVKLPGRKRAVGFRESEVEALMRGEISHEG